jgi:hypothetical protein
MYLNIFIVFKGNKKDSKSVWSFGADIAPILFSEENENNHVLWRSENQSTLPTCPESVPSLSHITNAKQRANA